MISFISVHLRGIPLDRLACQRAGALVISNKLICVARQLRAVCRCFSAEIAENIDIQAQFSSLQVVVPAGRLLLPDVYNCDGLDDET